MLEAIKQDPSRGFFCVDWDLDDGYELWGDENDDNFIKLDIILMPCNSISDNFGIMEGENGQIRPECVTSLKE